MRLFINGIPGEYNALARVWVEHKGHQVAIGSGFTAGERLRFAEDPGLIVSFSAREIVSRLGSACLCFLGL